MPQQFHCDGQHRHAHDDDGGDLDVVLDRVDLTEEEAERGDVGPPQEPAPATVGTKVRTMGTKRASTMVFDPCLAKNASAFTTYSGLKKRLFGRSKTVGPNFLPIMYPT